MGWAKTYLGWLPTVLCVTFVTYGLWQHWGKVINLVSHPPSFVLVVLAGAITLVAHSWSGWVWGWLIRWLGQPVPGAWITLVYLRTNIWKYLPGNIWHFYGRLQALRQFGLDITHAGLAVGLEPLIMAAAALIVGLAYPGTYWPWRLLILLGVMVGLQPRWINALLLRLKTKVQINPGVRLQRYPLQPLGGEVVFVLLRGLGFILVIRSLHHLDLDSYSLLMSRFSLAWLAGLVVPGAPGGVGVFEAVALGLLPVGLPSEVKLAGLALYRLVGTLTEVLAALLALLLQRCGIGSVPPTCPP
ncbi:MAG: UPF0104 family protein [Nodosilinea sp.]